MPPTTDSPIAHYKKERLGLIRQTQYQRTHPAVSLPQLISSKDMTEYGKELLRRQLAGKSTPRISCDNTAVIASSLTTLLIIQQ